MSHDHVLQAAKTILAEILDQSGALFISGVDTLVPGNLYVLGFNPGGGLDPMPGDGPPSDQTIGASLAGEKRCYNDWWMKPTSQTHHSAPYNNASGSFRGARSRSEEDLLYERLVHPVAKRVCAEAPVGYLV